MRKNGVVEFAISETRTGIDLFSLACRLCMIALWLRLHSFFRERISRSLLMHLSIHLAYIDAFLVHVSIACLSKDWLIF